ncbi:biopolymer transporter ExbD [Lutimaribacter sp. EGI FJ00015]|uniref:Biopolymer transporter ExbD n=1 Tax=Lutimaribacter degradans TaxID=2945989 RepID=A0ACC5ZXY8_9RHOB|nr:biopolymer transporter ExbD [Lutimaribacter sp. EGI FJ00013]MCM2563177.1 biopolymer transporter ExbD [Lutimaribacter sp. EGI FJ00013]MCO0614356.1 biopolymer transporter ExbD [Lutimaribacter sp. EGI FJ00015]MCO0637166.1 biopolymer transporter ExbD [Lutimaribacter sp. EGI FJ00014]
MIPRRARKNREPTIALINIVFLMLIFFLVAGTLAPALERDLALVRTKGLNGTAPPDALVVHADGRLTRAGAPVASAADFLAALPEDARDSVRIVPDRDLPARNLVALGRALREAGAGKVLIVTERGLE